MFTTVENWQFNNNSRILKEMFRLRASVFKDRLNWKVAVANGLERDDYDSCNPTYLVWCDRDRRTLYGSLRMMPTTGPTLLYDVFRETFPAATDLVAPGIWEGTRLCINESALAARFPNVTPARGFCVMLLALCETAYTNGIHTMISNYELPMLRLYRMAGARIQVLGKADKYGKRPVYAGAFEVTREVLIYMRAKIGIPCSLYLPVHETWLENPVHGGGKITTRKGAAQAFAATG